MKKWLRLLTVLAVLSLIAAACGSDDDGDTASDGDTSSDSSGDDSSGDDSSGDDSSGDDSSGDDSSGDDSSGDDSGGAGGEIATGIGIDDSSIKVGFLTDLTGIFAGLTVPIADGSEAYFERVNDNGGIAGREVDALVLDTSYDVPTHQQHYDTVSSDGADGVALIGTSVGSPHTASIREDLVDDDLFAIPLSWNSSWSAEESGNIFEWGTNYCVEAMNGIDYLATTYDAQTVAIVSFPGDYGEDGALGAKMAAEALGLEVVYDGQAAVVPGSDQTPVITSIVDSGADIVWTTINSTTLAEIMGGAAAAGFTGQWGGNGPSFSPLLLATEVGPLLDTNYTHFSPYGAIGGDAPGLADVRAMMREYRPDAPFLSVYVISWIQGEIVRQSLEAAAENGDMTRAGILEAAKGITFDMQGVIPDLDFSGDPNDSLVRSSYVFDVTIDTYDAASTVQDDQGEGLTLIDDAYLSSVAEGFEYEPCFGI